MALVRALDGAGTLAIFQGDYVRAGTFIEKGWRWPERWGPDPGWRSPTHSAFLGYRRREFARAEDCSTRRGARLGGSPTASQAGPFATPAAWAGSSPRGDLAPVQGQLAGGEHYEEAIALFRLAGNDWGWRDMQAGLAVVQYWTGDLPEAAVLYGESLQRSHEMKLLAALGQFAARSLCHSD